MRHASAGIRRTSSILTQISCGGDDIIIGNLATAQGRSIIAIHSTTSATCSSRSTRSAGTAHDDGVIPVVIVAFYNIIATLTLVAARHLSTCLIFLRSSRWPSHHPSGTTPTPVGVLNPGPLGHSSAPFFLGQRLLFERHGLVSAFHSSEVIRHELPLIGFLVRLRQVAAPTAGAAPRHDAAVDEATAGVAAAHC